MTRYEKITEAATNYYKVTRFFPEDFLKAAFRAGAIWADNNPDVDVRTQVAWQAGRKAAIDEVCEWIAGHWFHYENEDRFINALKREIQ